MTNSRRSKESNKRKQKPIAQKIPTAQCVRTHVAEKSCVNGRKRKKNRKQHRDTTVELKLSGKRVECNVEAKERAVSEPKMK